ncbi:MAG: succinate dehydrogenase cytochrome b subunit [Verrucomicrobia bacterium]|nr:succinate dehydrogenase cytochrome b subunit [Verrucomicrobiota bacterium]
MSLIAGLFQSSVGRKLIMAVTGVILFLFVVLHMVGNLQIFFGPEHLNAYALFLQSNVEILWPARIFLLATIGLHLWAAVVLTLENRAARPQGYADKPAPLAAGYASRTMLVSGLIVLCFIVYHLLHFTVQVPAVNLTGQDFKTLHDAKGRHDVYRMMVVAFGNPWVSGFYVLGMALLCLHLSHGLRALFQSLGLKNEAWGPIQGRFALAAAWIIFLGNCSMPAAVWLGVIR